jgi:16S rRNA processing protein RimM
MSSSEKGTPTADVIIGKVGRPHGVRGEVRVFTESEESETLAQVRKITLALPEGSRREYAIKHAKAAPRYWVLTLEGINDREAAAALVGAACVVPRSALPQLDDADEFYYHDLIGLDVVDASGTNLGRVIEIFDNGAHEVLVYSHTHGEPEMVPLIEEFVGSIDLDAGVIQIQPMELD